MPLRAVVDGRAVQVWDLDGGEWADLRRRCRADAGAVLMACCGVPGLAKASRNGNPFFAHRPGRRALGGAAAPPCRWAGESAAHALCKLLAAAGARRAGWEVRTEAAAPDGGWRADVLCARGTARVAIEVQLARAAPGELAARQERYRAAGVRGAWLVPAERCPAPCRGLPAFPLEGAGGAARVGPGAGASSAPGLTLPLDAFVAGLLLGRVRFEEARVVRPLGCPVAVTAPDACRRCGRAFEHVAGVTNIPAAARPRYRVGGDAVPVVALRDLWDADRWRAWSVADAVRRLRRAEPRLAPLAPRRCPVVGEAYLTALCPACGAAQGDGAVDRLLTGLHPRAPVRVPLPPAPLTYRPLDGRPPRPRMGDWLERAVPARWRLVPDGAAGERGSGPAPAPLRRAAPAATSGRHEGRADHSTAA
jgi:hypothetical protein